MEIKEGMTSRRPVRGLDRRLASADFLSMKATQRFAVRPFQVAVLTGRDGADPRLGFIDPPANVDLRHAARLNFRDECFPVHATIIRMLFIRVNSYLIVFCISILL